MDSLQIVVLAVVQGITEFLPISSSGHLILIPFFADWPDQGLEFDVAVHIGTLAAIVVYFRKTLAAMARDFALSVVQRREVGESRLAWAVLFGTIPAGVVGLLFRHDIETTLRSPWVVASTTVFYALLLLVADRRRGARDEHSLGWVDVVVIGCAQALSLVPGTSRSGVTMTAGLFRNLSREAAARFSFLLAVPVMTATGLADLLGYTGEQAAGPADTRAIVLGLVLSAATGFACIHYFLKWLTRFGMLPYVIYRLALGTILFIVLSR
ncbi:MAG TPA: undecaprenyl-diphosphate phosphatase [Gammaproteobacteria bacterium]|nr:undecaprenyl-diphosphate phosphatase [Gammaproteobacteria bacterium]